MSGTDLVTRDEIRAMLHEAASFVRFVKTTDVDSMTASHIRTLSRYTTAQVAAGFAKWIDMQDVENPAQTLPYPSAIRKLIETRKQRQGAGPVPIREKGPKPTIDPDFLEAHRSFQRWVKAQPEMPRAPHDHPIGEPAEHNHPPTAGNMSGCPACDCRGCQLDVRRLQYLELVADKADMLPAPATEDRTYGCRCAGNHVVFQNRDGSLSAFPQEMPGRFDPMPASLPCPDCNPDGYAEWSAGGSTLEVIG